MQVHLFTSQQNNYKGFNGVAYNEWLFKRDYFVLSTNLWVLLLIQAFTT